MKQGWERKTLGEFIREYSVRNKHEYDYPVYSVTNSAGFCKDYFSKEVASKDKTTYKIVPKGYFAYNPSRINVGSVDWQKYEDNVIVSPLYVVFKVMESIKQDYLLYYLKSSTTMAYIQNLATGTVRANLKFDILSKFPISIPTIAEQEKIVAELDCLSGIIEKKKQQLKELDALAQSIFYEMFGDPVENDKGWEIKKLGDVCDVRDGTHDSPKYLEQSDYLLITSKNIVDGQIDFSTANYLCEEDYININKRSNVDDGDIIMAMIGTIGKPIIVKGIDKKFGIKNVALIKFGGVSDVLNVYIRELLDNRQYHQYIQSLNKGGTQKFVALGTIRKLNTPIPPLALQQDFASKIEAIEKQKELIKQSIQETETLFNSRMDYYFN